MDNAIGQFLAQTAKKRGAASRHTENQFHGVTHGGVPTENLRVGFGRGTFRAPNREELGHYEGTDVVFVGNLYIRVGKEGE